MLWPRAVVAPTQMPYGSDPAVPNHFDPRAQAHLPKIWDGGAVVAGADEGASVEPLES